MTDTRANPDIQPHPDSPEPCMLDHNCDDDEMCSCWCELHDCPLDNCPSYKLVTAWIEHARRNGYEAGRASAAKDIRAFVGSLDGLAWQERAARVLEGPF